MAGPTTSTEGAFVVIVGPDGTGKTTLARALITAFRGPASYFHFRPPVRGPLRSAPPDSAAPPATKTPDRRRGDTVRGWVRLLRTAVHCTAAYWLRIRPALRRGGLVIGDRWMFGYLTQPAPLRYYGPRWLARTVISMAPEPTLTVNLTAPVPVLLARKQELSAADLTAELAVTSDLPVARMLTLSSEQPPELLASEVLHRLGRRDGDRSSPTSSIRGGSGHRDDER